MMSERDIVRGCKRGAQSAQRELFDRYSPHLMAVIYRYVSYDDDANDVLQDTFITVFSTIHHFNWEGEGSLKAWITRIAVNKSLNHLRRVKRLKVTTMPVESLGDTPDDEPIIEQDVNTIDVSTIMQMISELPDGYRTVFNLYCLDGYSHQEIAQQLGISEKTSSSQLARAKALLARKITAFINEQNNR